MPTLNRTMLSKQLRTAKVRSAKAKKKKIRNPVQSSNLVANRNVWES